MTARDPELADQLRCYQLQLAATSARPDLHVHQIRVYGEYIRAAEAAADGAHYGAALAAAGAGELGRAEWRDRQANARRVYQAIGDERAARSAALLEEAAEPTSDFPAGIGAALGRAAALAQAADGSASAVPRLVMGLIDWVTAPPGPPRDEARTGVAASWRVLREHDPGCTWARLGEYPPYRSRVPFDGAGLAVLGGWLRAIVGPQADQPGPSAAPAEPVAQPPAAATSPAPGPATIAELCAGYHAADAALDPADPAQAAMRRIYHRIFAIEAAGVSVPGLARALAEEDLLLRLAREPQQARCQAGLARVRGTGQPHLERHFEALHAALGASRTATEVANVVLRHGLVLEVERAWSEVFRHAALGPVRALLRWEQEPHPGTRLAVMTSDLAARALLGVGWPGLLRTAYLRDFVAAALWPRGGDGDGAPEGVVLGETGLSLVVDARAAAALRRAGRRFASPAALAAHLDDLRGAAGAPADAPAEPGRAVILWGRPVPLDAVAEAWARAPGPAPILGEA